MFYWTMHLKGAPKAFFHAAVSVGTTVYSFGGFCWETYKNSHIDVHVFDAVLLSWTELPSPLAPGEEGPGQTLSKREEVLSLYRWRRPVQTKGSYPYNPQQVPKANSQQLFEVPSMRCGHTAVLIGRTVYICGGMVNMKIASEETVADLVTTTQDYVSGDLSSGLYAFDVDTHAWSVPAASGSVPSPRSGHSACMLGRAMYVYGGDSQYHSGVYKLDTDTMVWSLTTDGANDRYIFTLSWHSATMIGTKMYIFGGSHGVWCEKNEVRVFDTESDRWLDPPPAPVKRTILCPSERSTHSAFTYKGELYVCGGCTQRDFWKFNPNSFSWTRVEPRGKGPRPMMMEPRGKGPRPMMMRGMCCCRVGRRVVFFGAGDTNYTKRLQHGHVHVLDLSPSSLKTLCKIAVVEYGLERTGMPHNVRWELMMFNR